MAKAQTMKPKSSISEWFKRLGAPKAKPAARPGTAAASSTMTNLQATTTGPASRTGTKARAASATVIRKPAAKDSGWSLADFSMPFIGEMPIIRQMQILGSTALVLLVVLGLLVFRDTTARTRDAAYISIMSQMQYHTQRLAKAAGLAARGQPQAFAQLQDSPAQFADDLGILPNRSLPPLPHVPPPPHDPA